MSAPPPPDALRTLIVDDDPELRASLRDVLEHEGFATLEAGDGKTALDLLDFERVDLLLLDLDVPRVSGVEVLRLVSDRGLDIPIVIISGTGSIPAAVRTMKLGAYDYLEKPLDARRTLQTVRTALSEFTRRRAETRTAAFARERYGLVGADPAMQRVFDAIEKAAASRARVLVLGESGTGKELVARAIHRLSARSQRPFVAVNCAAVPETLIESELFGHVEGAFTGARRGHIGSVQQAAGGTLFLDEIGDMSLMTQAKVLRVLETGELRPVGAEASRTVDFRLIAATNHDLAREVREGRFRDDLYYRVGVVTIQLPPLRQRRADLPLLIRHFAERHAAREDRPAREIRPAAMSLLLEHPWPGNARELSNVVERLMLFGDGGSVGAHEVAEALRREPPADEPAILALRAARARFERDHILTALEANGWRIQETASTLGINRSHLWKRMRGLGIEPPPDA